MTAGTTNAMDCSCRDAKCACCQRWVKELGKTLGGEGAAATSQDRQIARLKAENAELKANAVSYKKTIQELTAEKNGIKTVTASEPKEPGRRGRPPGQKATVNKRPERVDRVEVNDFDKCPKCGSHEVSDTVTDSYDRIVETTRVVTEYVKHIVYRRYCRGCKKQVSAVVPGAAPNARISSNCSAIAASLNMSGLSHGKGAKFCIDAMGMAMSASRSYRNKISVSERLASERDAIRRDVLKEPYLTCDELHWPLKNKRGYVLVAMGDKRCLMEVSADRGIETLKEFLSGYDGTVGQDSYTGWLHIGSDRQMCMAHQLRLVKKDIKYGNPEGDVLEFLTRLKGLYKQHYRADKIEDPHTRKVAANCLDSMMRELMHGEWKDDEAGTIARYKKRYRREGLFLTTYLRKEGIPIDSNGVERMNRKFVAIRSDGGGNRSPKGMEANSILFSVYATDILNGASFFEHVIQSAGYG